MWRNLWLVLTNTVLLKFTFYLFLNVRSGTKPYSSKKGFSLHASTLLVFIVKKPLHFLKSSVHIIYYSFRKSPVLKERKLFLYVSTELLEVTVVWKTIYDLFFFNKHYSWQFTFFLTNIFSLKESPHLYSSVHIIPLAFRKNLVL